MSREINKQYWGMPRLSSPLTMADPYMVEARLTQALSSGTPVTTAAAELTVRLEQQKVAPSLSPIPNYTTPEIPVIEMSSAVAEKHFAWDTFYAGQSVKVLDAIDNLGSQQSEFRSWLKDMGITENATLRPGDINLFKQTHPVTTDIPQITPERRHLSRWQKAGLVTQAVAMLGSSVVSLTPKTVLSQESITPTPVAAPAPDSNTAPITNTLQTDAGAATGVGVNDSWLN